MRFADIIGMYLTYCHGAGRPVGGLTATICVAWALLWEKKR